MIEIFEPNKSESILDRHRIVDLIDDFDITEEHQGIILETSDDPKKYFKMFDINIPSSLPKAIESLQKKMVSIPEEQRLVFENKIKFLEKIKTFQDAYGDKATKELINILNY